MMTSIFLNFGSAFGLSAVLTPLMRFIANKKGWVAQPTCDRWHKKPTALLGGIAIFAALFLPLLVMADFRSAIEHVFRLNGFGELPSLSAVLILGSVFLFFLGLFDDLHAVKPHNKLVAQILVASLVVFFGFRLHWFNSMTLDTMATLFWIVGITNAFNLIDNMDGLCAGVGCVASVSLAVLFFPADREAFLIALVLAGALGGFLIYNFNPAKIFMGDCGSLVIGFCVSVLTLHFSEVPATSFLARFTVPILILMVPILDTTLVTAIRLLSGRKASVGGRDHTSHRLVLMGYSESKAVLLLYGVAAIAGFAAVFVSRQDTLTSPVVIIPVLMAFTLMGIYLSQLRVYPEKEFCLLRNRSFTPILMELTYKRQILLVVLDAVIIAFSYYIAYRLRFGGEAFPHYFKVFLRSLPAVIACKMLVFFWMGVYRSIWGYISTNDVFLHVRASIVGSLLSIAAVTFLYRFSEFSKGIFLIDFLFTTGFLLGVRASFRIFLDTFKRRTLSGAKIVIYGAGRAGELLLREILNNKCLNVKPIGFVDDDVLKKGRKIQGFPIIGSLDELASMNGQYEIQGVLVSFNNGNGACNSAHEKARQYCLQKGLFLKRFRIDLQEVNLND
jgi:UDP-GlcNAc:undecaprenyl-phosphate GlcNAc-1-phosphate transferase